MQSVAYDLRGYFPGALDRLFPSVAFAHARSCTHCRISLLRSHFGFDGCRVRQYRVSRRSAFKASPPCLGLYLYRADKQSQECRECLPLVAEDVAFSLGIERYDTFAPFDCRRVSFAYRFGRTGIAESLIYAAFAGKSLSTRFFSSATLLYAKL